MLIIETRRIPNGERHTCNGIYVDVTHDQRFMTIYGMNDEPLGTITRPRVGKQQYWSISNKFGEAIPGTMFGARSAFARFLRREMGLNVSLFRGTCNG